ncbi:pectin acetylesterase-family hydrolase [Isoptericola sp. NPDC057653]|uniref:pectin acetylesterase-family hydrolase n=1 Tax=Isoptericola sp. NPDC057653 TaxID=3346195 RepID=UPI0036793F02
MTPARRRDGLPRHRRSTTTALLLVALASALGACTPTPGLEWDTVAAPADCRCADGSEFHFWERRADTKRVVLFLNGGGVCWDAATCALTGEHGDSGVYDWNIQGTEPENRTGMFDVTRRDNPFRDWSFVYVSSCTGDAHLGDATQEYAPGLTVEHRGAVNGRAALDHLAATYPDATDVVVIGKTAGSVAAPVYGGLVADLLPDARVTVLGAQSGAWPDHPDLDEGVLDARWGAYDAAPDWAVDGLAARDWGPPAFWVRAGRHDPDLVLGRFDYAYDPHASSEVARWIPGDPPDLLAQIDANEERIEAAGVPVHSYTAPGAGHGIFEFDAFYTTEVDGVRLVDWIADLVGDDPPADVRCADCSAAA